MSDNVAITAGSGTTIAADDVGAGVLVQRVKATWGPDGTANDADVATGKPLPTQLRSPTGVDLTGSAGTASAAVLTVQGIASGTPQPISGTVTANAGTGNFATVPGSTETKVTAATIGTGGVGYLGWLSTIANYLAGTLTVATHAVTQSGSWVIAAGSAIIGKVGIDQTTDGTTNKVAAGQNGTWTVQPGNTPNTTPWLTKLHDGVTAGKILAASTAPVATDPALVVALSPNSAGVLPTVAHDTADSGDPIKMGGRARSSEITPVANNDRSDFITDLAGKQIVMPYANPENFVSGAVTSAMTGTTSTSLVAAPASGLRNYITTIVCSNAHATVGTDIAIQDGSGGTTLMVIPAAAVYGGAVINLPVPLRQPTTATAIYCANVTTGASTKVSAVGYKGV